MSLLERVRDWLAQDPDPETRAELEAIVTAVGAGDTTAAADLAARFSGRLEFGTAGLRAELGAGPMRMNRVVVAQTAAGLAAYLREREEHPSIVIGYDGRKNSDVFARDTAEIMAGAGIAAILLPRKLPTPVLAYAVRHFGVSAGVMVTASHNPPRDNGYKVYLGGEDGGSQIVSPADAEIAARIEEAARTPITEYLRAGDFAVADEAVIDAYIQATAAIVSGGSAGTTTASAGTASGLKVVYTPLHGVGLETITRVFREAGLPELTVVEAQAQPDGDFPTVAFPNPEEPGALDLAYAEATAHGADLIVANDPDADRLAVAIPAGDGWRRLSGNEIGTILGWAAAESAVAAASPGQAPRGVLAASLVSSPALGRIARHFGLEHAETLTGFKWISRVPGLIYGYEEALGYLVDPDKVRDKDGISAAVRFVDLVRRWHAEGRTVNDVLAEISAAIGPSASGQVSIRVTGLSEITRITTALRQTPPTAIAGHAVVDATDYAGGIGAFPPSDILRYTLDDGSRIIVRPSGTEPKLKVYLDAASDAAIAELDAGVRALLDAL